LHRRRRGAWEPAARARARGPAGRPAPLLCAQGAAPRELAAPTWHAAAKWTDDPSRLVEDEELDAIVFETSSAGAATGRGARSRRTSTSSCAGPLARTAKEADELLTAAARRNRRVRVYHESLARSGVTRLRALVDSGALGDVYYVRGSRTSDGRDGAVTVRDLGGDLVALVLDLLRDEPIATDVRAESYFCGTADLAFVDLRFATGITCHLHVSALEAAAAYTVTVVGSRMTATLDLSGHQQLTLHAASSDGVGLEAGDALVPQLRAVDPLVSVAESFVAATRSAVATSAIRDATSVVAILDALDAAVAASGEPEVEAASGPPDLRVVELHGG
jgi:predicted dehydrogenase